MAELNEVKINERELNKIMEKLHMEEQTYHELLMRLSYAEKCSKETTHLESEQANLEKRIEMLKNQVPDFSEETYDKYRLLIRAEDQIKGIKKRLSKMIRYKDPSEIEFLKQKVNEYEKRLEQLKSYTTDSEIQSEKNHEIKNIETVEFIENKIKELEDKTETVKEELYKLESIKVQQGDNKIIQIVENAKISGVHAPLYKLGKVDEKYSTAIAAAIGGRMEHIVVDDSDVAVKVFEVIRSAKIGRIACIPLDKINKAPANPELPEDDGIIDFAINLINFDDIYLNAFYYALGETLVVRDDKVAKKLLHKYRMVTLDGTLYEKTGAIVGGGITLYNRFKFCTKKVCDEELFYLEHQLSELDYERNMLLRERNYVLARQNKK